MKRVLILIIALCTFTVCFTACNTVMTSNEYNSISAAIVTAENANPSAETATIETGIVRIEITGRKISVTELETGTVYTFTLKPVLRKKGNPSPTARTLIDDDILQILTFKGVIAVHEKATGKIHLM